MEQREGEIAPQHRAELRDLPRRPEPVEARGERLLQGRRDRLRAAFDAALQQEAGDLLDEQRHAAGAFAHALHHLLGQRMARGEFADHARDLAAIERRERDDAMMRPQAPGRAELRPRRRDDEERRLCAALGERPQEIERGRVRPVQVLEREHDRLRARARQKQGRHRRQLPASQFLRRKYRRAVLGQGDVEQRREQRRIFGRVEADQPQSALQIGEPPLGRDFGAAVPQAAPFGERVQEACSAAAATRPIRPRCAASRRVFRGTPRSNVTCRCRARRRSARNGPRLEPRAPIGA